MRAPAIVPAVLKVDRLAATADGDPLFEDVSFTLGPGERLGVVGPNGVGKSTLLRVLAGAHPAERGHVSGGAEVGYLEQEIPDPSVRVGDYLMDGLAEVAEATKRMRESEARLTHDSSPSALREYGEALERWTALDGWGAESRVEELRDRLGIADLDPGARLAEVSGGQQARLMLARLLLGGPAVLLLDEPTNHLDAAGVDWLGAHLADYPGAVVVVSHDRAFLDRVVHRVVELDGIHPEPQWYAGGYTDYRRERAERWRKLLLDHEAQEKARARLEEDIERTRAQALGVELSTRNDRLRRYAKKVARKAKARERRLRRQMRSAAWIERPTERPRLVVDLAGESDPSAVVARVSSARLALGDRVVLDGVDLAVNGGDRVVVSGVNGGGKSTLLRALAGEVSPVEGAVEVPARAAYLPQVHDRLPMDATPLTYLRGRLPMYEEDAEALLDTYLFDADAIRRPLRGLSPGEVRRLLVACLVNSGAELLLLDEPTNHLDFDSLDVVEEALRGFRGTLVVVTHDRYFADRVHPTRHWRVAEGQVAVEVSTPGGEAVS